MLHVRLIHCLLCAAAALPALARADEPKSADEVIAKFIEAIGGQAKLEAIKTQRATGKMVIGGGMMEAPFTTEHKRPNRFRMNFTFQGMTGSRAFDGAMGWSVMPFAGKTDPEKMSEEDVKQLEDQLDMDGPLVDYKKKGHQIELIGKDEIEGAPTYKLKVTKKNGTVEYHYLDAEHFIPIKVKGKVAVQGTEVEFETSLGDYKEVGGVLMAHSIQQQAGGMGGNSMVLEKIEVNVDLPDSLFTMPEAKKEEPKEPKPDEKKPEGKKPDERDDSD